MGITETKRAVVLPAEILARIAQIAQDESRSIADRLNHIHLLVERQLEMK